MIILHTDSGDGQVEHELLIFESKKSEDYHEEMNASIFKNWFQILLVN